MREIKFRGQSIVADIWIYGYIVFHSQEAFMVPINDVFRKEPEIPQPMNWTEVDIETVGQYTGLKDKNGKEIYEGDVVRYYWEDGQQYHVEVLHIVKFTNARFMLIATDKRAWDIAIDRPDWCEIIGNIYENTELLKSEP